MSTAQLDIARSQATVFNLDNVMFVEGSAYDSRLPKESFDLVYCRFLLIHLNRALDALIEMRSLLKPGGLLVVKKQILVKLSASHLLKFTIAVMKC